MISQLNIRRYNGQGLEEQNIGKASIEILGENAVAQ